ncbi:hypothetical protein TPL01_16090 [Sulfuriferula plumbiphila]|uniref:Uncharacterized protein n=1 Tax=Sulfuriferula plumbiphila TaxID=171865 RepID=A0A512L8J6_9PROT|nr:tetratricopeptide repeat protein [Sulfuriferula plumbiphila]BBP04012.1 hypothetical protein SFPGR_14340 [Sulfuriferula plumbiphila]GEP30471.1 hypothetical protein TPL01_16090 [Sulfuriferula plumbiphila]
MSVINQMLQDLENRHSATGADASLSAQVKAVPKRSRVHPAWRAVLALVLVAGMLAWLLRPIPKVADAPPPGTIADAPVTQAKSSRDTQHLPPASVPAPPTQPFQLDSQARAAPQPAATQMLTPERRQLPEQQAVLPPTAAARLDPGKQQLAPVNAASSRSRADSGKPNPAAQTQQDTLPDGQAGSGVRAVPGSMAVTRQIKEITPQQRAENEYGKAVALLQQGRVTEASELLGNVLQLDPGNTAARQTLVGLLVAGRRYGEAERSLQDGLKLDPSQTGLAMILARLQVEQGDTRSGLKTLQHSLPYAAERPDYQAFLAALLQRAGRHKEAIEHYLQALRQVPGSGVWLMGLGISLQAENRLAEAQEAYTRARASNTLSPDLQAYVEQQLKQLKQHSIGDDL